MGRQESEGLIVPPKPANGPPRPEPVEGRGLPGQPAVAGKQGGYIETRSPVNVRAADSSACGRKRGSHRATGACEWLAGRAGCLNWARPDPWEPWAGDRPGRPG